MKRSEDGRRKPEVGGRKSEVGGRKSEDGSRKSEVGGRKSEVWGSRVFVLGLRLLISGLFLYSGWIKILDSEAFMAAVQGYQILPDALIVPVAALVPWLEVWCALALWITPPFRRAAWMWILLMLLVFTVAKISVLQRGIATSCGCSGSDALMTWKDVWSNLIWLGLSVSGWRWDRRG